MEFSEKQYVCVVDRSGVNLGFAIPALYRKDGEPTASFKKRMCTVDEWGSTTERVADDSGGYSYVRHPASGTIMSNDFSTGFSIVGFATRCATSNRLIRINDPRGFQLEISVECLIDLMQSCTIKNGIIVDKCRWTNGGELVTKGMADAYAKEHGDEYKDRYKGKVRIKDIPIGSTVVLAPTKKNDRNDADAIARRTVVWLGQHHTVTTESIRGNGTALRWSKKPRWCYHSANDSEPSVRSRASVKVVSIVDVPLIDIPDLHSYINGFRSWEHFHYSPEPYIIPVSSRPFKPNNSYRTSSWNTWRGYVSVVSDIDGVHYVADRNGERLMYVADFKGGFSKDIA